MEAAVAATAPSLVSLILSFCMALGLIATPSIPNNVSASLSNDLTVAETNVLTNATIGKTVSGDLNFALSMTESEVTSGLSFKNGQFYITEAGTLYTLSDYLYLQEYKLQSGLITPEDTAFYQTLSVLQPFLAYAGDGRLQQDIDAMSPLIKSNIPLLSQVLNVTEAATANGTEYAFTLHLRDLPATAMSLGLRALAFEHTRSVINGLNLWKLIEGAPENIGDRLLYMLGQTRINNDELPPIVLPVTLHVDADGRLTSLNAATTLYVDDESCEIALSYANGSALLSLHPYDEDGIPLGRLDVTASMMDNIGQFDVYFEDDNSNSFHTFGNCEMKNGVVTLANAQVTSAGYYGLPTLSLSYRQRPSSSVLTDPRRLIITCNDNGNGSATLDLYCYKRDEVFTYTLDASSSSYSEYTTLSGIGDVVKQENGDLSNAFMLNVASGGKEAANASFTQILSIGDNTVSQHLKGAVRVMQEEGTQSYPISCQTTITLN